VHIELKAIRESPVFLWFYVRRSTTGCRCINLSRLIARLSGVLLGGYLRSRTANHRETFLNFWSDDDGIAAIAA